MALYVPGIMGSRALWKLQYPEVDHISDDPVSVQDRIPSYSCNARNNQSIIS
jgi:hypothetical protein